VNSLSCIPPSLAELPLRRKTSLLLGLYEFLLRALFPMSLRDALLHPLIHMRLSGLSTLLVCPRTLIRCGPASG
jgi:hypothetical protein